MYFGESGEHECGSCTRVNQGSVSVHVRFLHSGESGEQEFNLRGQLLCFWKLDVGMAVLQPDEEENKVSVHL